MRPQRLLKKNVLALYFKIWHLVAFRETTSKDTTTGTDITCDINYPVVVTVVVVDISCPGVKLLK